MSFKEYINIFLKKIAIYIANEQGLHEAENVKVVQDFALTETG